MTHFHQIPDFKADSFSPVCPITHLPKQEQPKNEPPKQPHEVDAFILRGPEVTFFDGRGERSMGFFDVRPAAIAEAAIEHLGMVRADEIEKVEQALKSAESALGAARAEVESLKAQVAALTLGNAELIVQQESLLQSRFDDSDYEAEDTEDYLDMLDSADLLSVEELAELESK